jgi:hypothetical protein
MALATDEFIRSVLLHALPSGVHRIPHYGLLAGSSRKTCIARARKVLNAARRPLTTQPTSQSTCARHTHAAADA